MTSRTLLYLDIGLLWLEIVAAGFLVSRIWNLIRQRYERNR